MKFEDFPEPCGYSGNHLFPMQNPPVPEATSDDFSRTRRSLLVRMKSEDNQKGWRDFMEKYGRFIYGMARKSGFTQEEAEDVM